jgi:hypothetical protein
MNPTEEEQALALRLRRYHQEATQRAASRTLPSRTSPRRSRRHSFLQLGAATFFATLLAAAVIGPRVLTPGGVSNEPSQPVVAGAQHDPSDTASPSPTTLQSPISNGSNCATLNVTEDRMQVTVAEESAHSTGVLVGGIISVSGRWATPDGSAPTGVLTPNDVYSLVIVRVASAPKPSTSRPDLTTAGSTVTVRMRGGTVGCNSVRFDDQPQPKVGNSIALFLNPGSLPSLASVPTANFDVMDAWAVSNGTVIAPDGTQFSMAAFTAAATGR